MTVTVLKRREAKRLEKELQNATLNKNPLENAISQ
jgi:hypothetical protein